MRERHFPRLCRACQAPMARQEDTCWSCGSRWQTEGEPPPAAPGPARSDEARSPGAPIEARRRAAAGNRVDVDRWADEGGRVGAEPVAGRT
jgi:predicted amidophosphoribosyltransferase